MKPKGEGKKIVSTNKEARFRYFLEDFMEAGLVLKGTEVKSMRTGKVQLSDSYVFVKNGEAFIANMHISEYSHGNLENHEPLRERKLLLNRKEIDKIAGATQEQGKTIIPTELYFSKGKAKLEIAVGKGKKIHDKRESIKNRDAKREMDRARKI